MSDDEGYHTGEEEDQDEVWQDANDSGAEGLDLHRVCFMGDLQGLQRLLAKGVSREQFTKLDPHGHTALHLAVLRHHKECVAALLKAGCPAKTKSSESWRPCHEAAATGQRDVALMLAHADVEQQRLRGKEKRKELMNRLALMPDFSLQLKWTLDSSVPGVGLLLKKFAPNDVYKIWKQGSLIRMDGSLKGVDGGSEAMIPGWKRGHFSIVYDGTGDKSQGAFIDHEKKTYTDLKEAKKKGEGNALKEAVEKEVEEMMQQKRMTRRKMKPKAFRFEPARGWLGQSLTERVEGWPTKLYDASANMVKVTRFRGVRDLTRLHTFEDYLACELEPDVIQEVPVNPYNPASYKKSKPKPSSDTNADGHAGVSSGTTSAAGSAKHQSKKDGSADHSKDAIQSAKPLASSSSKLGGPRGGSSGHQKGGHTAKSGPSRSGVEDEGDCSTTAGGQSSLHKEGQGGKLGGEVSERTSQGSIHKLGASGSGRGVTNGVGEGSKKGEGLICNSKEAQSADDGHSLSMLDKKSMTEDESGMEGLDLEALEREGFVEDEDGEEDEEEEEEEEEREGAPLPTSFKATPEQLKHYKRISGRCWMASKFPLSLKEILPVLQLIGGANKHFYKVESFLSNYAERSEFPVRVDIPLILTISIRLAFKAFQLIDASKRLPASFFATQPAGYRKKDHPALEEAEEGKAEEGVLAR